MGALQEELIITELSYEHLAEVFICKVNRLAQLRDIRPRTTPIRIDMANYLRSLVRDSLAKRVVERNASPLIVLVVEPGSGSPRRERSMDIPSNLSSYAIPITEQFHPPGNFHCPYTLDEYLDQPIGVLMSAAVTLCECIRMLSDKLGGIHMAGELVDGTRPKPCVVNR